MRNFLMFILCFPVLMIAQGNLQGYILDKATNSPIFGAVVLWENTNVAVISDEKGAFEIPRDSSTNVLVVTYLGFQTRKFEIADEEQIVVELAPSSSDLDVVEIKIEKPSTNISMYSTIKVEELNQKALEKAACCNLSESFETNPTVDASYTDAVTGSKQIQLLGLAGPYALITTGNIPTITGNSAVTGLDFVPGQWLESIQLMKGTGSVVNGYSSVSGQINAEYKHYEELKFFLNGYADASSRSEMNLIIPEKKGHLKKGVFLQTDYSFEEMDNNDDGFMDNQTGPKVVGMILTRYENDSSNWENQTAIKFDFIDKTAGQLSSFENPYVFNNQQQKLDIWTKTGYVFSSPGRSFGMQFHAFSDNKRMLFGNRTLNAKEQKFYVNLIYADILGNTNHSYKTGFSYSGNLIDNSLDSIGYSWVEHVPGVFYEYSYVPGDKVSVVAGGRIDYSSRFGFIATPRVHARWELGKGNVFRSTIGYGSKTPNPLLENFGVLASSRKVIIEQMDLEQAMNIGGNYSKKWKIKKREFTFSTDFYHTYFYNKMLANYDLNSQEIHFYSLERGSYANSFMTQVIGEPMENLTLNIAYRWYDIQSKFNGNEYSQQPLNAQHRVMGNFEWQISPKWNLDYTLVWNGKSRIPQLNEHPDEFQREKFSMPYWLHNSQVKWTASSRWEAYLGAENLFNFKQNRPIIAAEDPFGEYFDASLIWGPVFGRRVYGGFRYEF